MQNPLISVIVPIYKVEKYLCECVDSIINQTYKKLEIILVDDGSPDGCGEICDKYAEQDERISVIHKKNGGLSDARNAGIKQCKGEYIVFVDSDDYMTFNGIELLVNSIISNDADIVVGGVKKFEDSTKNIIWKTSLDSPEIVQNSKEAIIDVLENGCASWARIYKSSLYKNILFPVGEINEDEAIVIDLLKNSKKIVKINDLVYCYRYRSESITSTNWTAKKLDWVNHCKSNIESVADIDKDLIYYAEKRYTESLIWALNNMSLNPDSFNDILPLYKKELKKMLGFGYASKLSKREKIRAYLLTHCFSFYSKVVILLGKQYT